MEKDYLKMDDEELESALSKANSCYMCECGCVHFAVRADASIECHNCGKAERLSDILTDESNK